MKKRTHRGVRPKKTTHDYAMVRVTKAAQHQLVEAARWSGETMTALASEVILRALRK